MRVLIFGLPGSGKTTLAKMIVSQVSCPCLYLNGDQVRSLSKNDDFSINGRIHQAKRMKALADQATQDLVIADFVCPLNITREIFDANLVVWMNTILYSRFEDTNLIFEKPKKVDIEVTRRDALYYSHQIIAQLSVRSPT